MTKEQWLDLWTRGLKYAVYSVEGVSQALPLQPPQIRRDKPAKVFRTLGEAWEYAFGHKPCIGYNMRDEGRYVRDNDDADDLDA